jgi:hypothetical protein
MSNLIEHARTELERCGQFEEDPRFAQSLVAAVAAFASYDGHSGSSAEIGAELLADLLRFRNLSALTNDPEEWIGHTPDMWDGENHVWQNRRNGAALSTDGGRTYTLTSDPKDETGNLPVYIAAEAAR